MRQIRPSGSEGGASNPIAAPYPYHLATARNLSSKRDNLPNDERLALRSNGPRLPPGKRVTA